MWPSNRDIPLFIWVPVIMNHRVVIIFGYSSQEVQTCVCSCVRACVRLFSSGVLCKLYAGDLKLYSTIHDALVAWSNQWQLSISSKKLTVLYLGQTSVNQSCEIKHASISPVSVIRDLGILIDNKLTMSQHICTVVNKAQTRASLIFKCFYFRHWSTLLKAIITYVHQSINQSKFIF